MRGTEGQIANIAVEGVPGHEMRNWLWRVGWTVHFKDKELGVISGPGKISRKEHDELQGICAATGCIVFGGCVDELKSMP